MAVAGSLVRGRAAASEALADFWRQRRQARQDALAHRRQMELQHGYPVAQAPTKTTTSIICGAVVFLGVLAFIGFMAALVVWALTSIDPMRWVEAWMALSDYLYATRFR